MSDRQEIAARHGIPDLADQLVGETAPELEADAAARAALRQREQEPPPDPLIAALEFHAERSRRIYQSIFGQPDQQGDDS